MPSEVIIIIALIIALVISIPVTWVLAVKRTKEEAARTVGDAQERAKNILEKANEDAENAKREALLKAKEENMKAKNELDKETKERRSEIQRYERRVFNKEEALDKKLESVEAREQTLSKKEDDLKKQKKDVEALHEKRLKELERVSGFTTEQAKEYLLESVKDDVKHECAMIIKNMQEYVKEDMSKKAKTYVVEAIQKCAVEQVCETSTSVVNLPNDELKGRIIGREGRNIRTFETISGTTLLIDDTPEAVVVSACDNVRREIACIALNKLISDGRIHPAKIEESIQKATREVELMMQEDGEAATLEVGVHGIHPELIKLLGKLKYRTSYGQNVLKHSIEVALIAGTLAAEVGVDVRTAKRAGLLHDIGKAMDQEIEGTHSQIGMDLCKKYKESPIVVNAVASHHGEVEAESFIACLVQAADAISAARPGARRETVNTYLSRITNLEDIANSYKGVEKSFAIQAGREIRVMVSPEEVNDDDMVIMARDIAGKIQDEMKFPGMIKVTVVRESRVYDYAK